jgi:UDP-N-acetylglucosamine--N-acetylmuramyl-(pentapeptide) pyrophosphoryl-undecaprenol N-acetylglucosamine transferase
MPSDNRSYHIAIACGGTGGHIFPGLATADCLRDRGHKVTLWLTGRTLEAKAVEGSGYAQVNISSKGWDGNWKAFHRFVWNYMNSGRRALKPMKEEMPDVLLAMGSHAGMGPVRAAQKLGIPYVLHEANSVPGRMVSYFAGKAARVGATFESTRYELKEKAHLHITGMPLRSSLAAEARVHQRVRSEEEPFQLLCMGGSLGARSLNLLVRRAVRSLHTREKNIFITHLTGPDDEESVRTCYEQASIPHHVAVFENDMAPFYKRADLAISRAGASSIAELSAFGIPSLLVPWPDAAKNHQVINAEEFFRNKAVDMIEERYLEVDWLTDYLEGCMHTPQRLEQLRTAFRQRSMVDAAGNLARLVEEAAMNDD